MSNEMQIVPPGEMPSREGESFEPSEEDRLKSHELRQQLIEAGRCIDDAFRVGAAAITQFLNQPNLMRLQGWDTEEEFWADPDVQRVVRVELGTQMLLKSYVQRQRAKFMLWAHATFPDVDWSLVRHSTVTQTSRAKALRELAARAEAEHLDANARTEQAEAIIFAEDKPAAAVGGAQVKSQSEPKVTVVLQGEHFIVSVNEQPLIELSASTFGIRFASMALHLNSPTFHVEETALVVYYGDAEHREKQNVGRFLSTVNVEDVGTAYVLDKTYTKMSLK